jgi:hypothetical protein
MKFPPEYATTAHKRLYQCYQSMVWRCSGRIPRYNERYFDRGIKVCDEWDYWPAFAKWALANGYADHLEIDRTDNDKGYSPENCRWVTKTVQNRNRDMELVKRSIKATKTRQFSKPFKCDQTGQVFETEIEASRVMGLDRRNIGRVLIGMYKQIKGYTFHYLNLNMEAEA